MTIPIQPLSAGLRPGRLWSLWEMLVFDAGIVSEGFNNLALLEALLAAPDSWIDQRDRRDFYATKMAGLQSELAALGLKVSLNKADQIHTMLTTVDTFSHAAAATVFKQACVVLRENIQVELRGRKFYGPVVGYEKYYAQVELFGPAVFKNFASANEDVYEAGMCLSLERGTACVMHLMRVQEVGLTVLAAAVGVSKKNDWGSYLREIEAELDRKAKAAGARSADEQFYAEAAASFDRLRRAYRNPTMHPEKTYSPERAEEILLAAKSFMAFLATRLSE